eukprot:scaffold10993_cov39-Isochrysis_galbana.AAC.1
MARVEEGCGLGLCRFGLWLKIGCGQAAHPLVFGGSDTGRGGKPVTGDTAGARVWGLGLLAAVATAKQRRGPPLVLGGGGGGPMCRRLNAGGRGPEDGEKLKASVGGKRMACGA